MVKFGFIGFGNMAKMMINGLIKFANVNASEIIVTRKNVDRLTEISENHQDIKVCASKRDIIKYSQYIFICVKPSDFKNVLEEIKPFITEDTYIISLAGTVKLNNIESLLNCKVSKLMPTIVSEIGEGISLVCHGAKVTEEDTQLFNQYIGKLSKVKLVDDKDIGYAAELTSCMPGFVASICKNMTNIALKHTASFTLPEITEMVTCTLYATSKLLIDKQLDYASLIDRVATKGGITQEGVSILDEMLPDVFELMFTKTLEKRRTVETRISNEITLLD